MEIDESRNLRKTERIQAPLSILSLSPRPKGDRIRYSEDANLFHVAGYIFTSTYNPFLGFSFPFSQELLNTDLLYYEQVLPEYDSRAERVTEHEWPPNWNFTGVTEISNLSFRPTFMPRQTNQRGTPRSGGVTFEVEGRRPMRDIRVNLMPITLGARGTLTEVDRAHYSLQWRDKNRQTAKIQIQAFDKIAEVPGLCLADQFAARLDIEYVKTVVNTNSATPILFESR